MFLVGLTGGIAAGKSTVAKRWVELGGIEIDADQLARDVVAPGTDGLAELVTLFGNEILDESGSLDRKRLGAIVFNDKDKLNALNNAVHPRVKALTKTKLAELPSDSIAIYNVPLLVEAAVDHDFDFVVTVEAPEEEQIKRLMKHRGYSPEEALARIRNQAAPVERAAVADSILSSNQDIHLLLRDADALWAEIERKAEAKRHG